MKMYVATYETSSLMINRFEIHCFTMFITAFCVIFLMKLRWLKNKFLYGSGLQKIQDYGNPSMLARTKAVTKIQHRTLVKDLISSKSSEILRRKSKTDQTVEEIYIILYIFLSQIDSPYFLSLELRSCINKVSFILQ